MYEPRVFEGSEGERSFAYADATARAISLLPETLHHTWTLISFLLIIGTSMGELCIITLLTFFTK